MGEVITPTFGNPSKPTGPFERVYGVVAGVEVGLLRVPAPLGMELHVAVGFSGSSFRSRSVAILLASPDGEEEAERIGLAVVQGLQVAQSYGRDPDTCA